MSDPIFSSPVWPRVSSTLNPAARLLLIIAPRGFGRHRFANDWIATYGGVLIDLAAQPRLEDPAGAARRITHRLAYDPGARFAVLLPPVSAATSLAWHSESQLISAQDLLLTVEEVAELSGNPPSPGGEEPSDGIQLNPYDIWKLTGGWCRGAECLSVDYAAIPQVTRDLHRSLAPWLAALDPDNILAEAAFLPSYSPSLLTAFFSTRHIEVPEIEQLAEACLIRPDGRGGWMMPELVRRMLLAALRNQNPGRARHLQDAALLAAADTGNVSRAIRDALAHRRWKSLVTLLLDRWVDLFITNPRFLLRAALSLPAWMVESIGPYSAALKILAAAGKDRIIIPFPTTAPNYGTDRTALWLREQTDKQFQRPDSNALTLGLIELGILRFHGHYRTSAEAALRLRKAVSRATASHPVRPLLAGIVELHCGMSLHIADRRSEAINAYETALHWGATADNAFLQANACANLALVHAQEGNTETAREMATRTDRLLPRIRWGAQMVARGAHLAHAFIAFHELDLQAMNAALDKLPEEPDNDEFWSIHAELLSLRDIYSGSIDSGRNRVGNLRRERVYAAQSPMAERALNVAASIAAVRSGRRIPIPDTRPAELLLVAAEQLIMAGDQHAAGHLLRTAESVETGLRFRYALRNLQLAASHPEKLPPEALETISGNYQLGGALLDLSVLWPNQKYRDQLKLHLTLADDQVVRLDRHAPPTAEAGQQRPELTDREIAILSELRLGRSRAEIARVHGRSLNTVKSQISSLYRKLGATSKAQALSCASKWGY